MRTAQEYVDRQLKKLSLSLQRPRAYCGSRPCDFLDQIILDLMWLQDRPQSDCDCVSLLLGGSQGVFGQLHYQKHNAPDAYTNEVTSTYAEASFRLGYFKPSNLLTKAQYLKVESHLDVEFFRTDHVQTEIIEQFGPPTHDIRGGQTSVHCYGCDDPSTPWIYLDYSRCLPSEYCVTDEYFTDERLRDVRRNRNKFELLPFGEWFGSDNTESASG